MTAPSQLDAWELRFYGVFSCSNCLRWATRSWPRPTKSTATNNNYSFSWRNQISTLNNMRHFFNDHYGVTVCMVDMEMNEKRIYQYSSCTMESLLWVRVFSFLYSKHDIIHQTIWRRQRIRCLRLFCFRHCSTKNWDIRLSPLSQI